MVYMVSIFFLQAPQLKEREGWLFAWPLLVDIRTPVLSPLAVFCLRAVFSFSFFFFIAAFFFVFELVPVRTVGPAGTHSA